MFLISKKLTRTLNVKFDNFNFFIDQIFYFFRRFDRRISFFFLVKNFRNLEHILRSNKNFKKWNLNNGKINSHQIFLRKKKIVKSTRKLEKTRLTEAREKIITGFSFQQTFQTYIHLKQNSFFFLKESFLVITPSLPIPLLEKKQQKFSNFLKKQEFKIFWVKNQKSCKTKKFKFQNSKENTQKFLEKKRNVLFYILYLSIEFHFFKVKKLLQNKDHLSLPKLIMQLNQEIRYWSDFYSHLKLCLNKNSNEYEFYYKTMELLLLNKMNYYLYNLLWTWAKKRHNQQSNNWIFYRYWFLNSKKNDWTFGTKTKDFTQEYYLMKYNLLYRPVIEKSQLVINFATKKIN